MLVDAVEVVQNPQMVGPVGVRSLVRLQSLNDCLRIWVPSADLAEATSRGRGSVPPELVKVPVSHAQGARPIFVPEDRELGGLREVTRQRAGMCGGEAVGQEVETRTEVVEEVADEHADRVARWPFGGGKPTGSAPRVCFRPDE
jgi:hypothetical protein